MSVKDFDAAVAASTPKEFVLCGQKFAARAELSWRTFANLMSAFTRPGVTEVEATPAFFDAVLRSKADREIMRELLSREDDGSDDIQVPTNGQIAAVVAWLVDEYQGKAEK